MSIGERVSEIERDTELTKNEINELRGVLVTDKLEGTTIEEKIAFLKVQSEYWRDKAKEGQNNKTRLYDALAATVDQKMDVIRLRDNQRPETEEAKRLLVENDLTRFEMFKK